MKRPIFTIATPLSERRAIAAWLRDPAIHGDMIDMEYLADQVEIGSHHTRSDVRLINARGPARVIMIVLGTCVSVITLFAALVTSSAWAAALVASLLWCALVIASYFAAARMSSKTHGEDPEDNELPPYRSERKSEKRKEPDLFTVGV